jgi:hypothetical protein
VGAETTFAARVKIASINPYVDVPARVVAGLGANTKAVLVKVSRPADPKRPPARPPRVVKLQRDAARLTAIARLDAAGWFRTTLVPSRSGPTRLYLDTWMREAAGLAVGDRARVRLRRDDGSRELPIPTALGEALSANPVAKSAWDQLPPSRRREILTYLNFLKTPAALESRVQKTIALLSGK